MINHHHYPVYVAYLNIIRYLNLPSSDADESDAIQSMCDNSISGIDGSILLSNELDNAR